MSAPCNCGTCQICLAVAQAHRSVEKAKKDEEIKSYRRDRDYKVVSDQKDLERRLAERRIGAVDPDFKAKHAAATLRRIHATSVHFITNDFTAALPRICEGDLVLVGAQSKHGKSSVAANLAADNIARGLRVLVLTNEETETAVRNRVACIKLGYSYALMENNRLAPENVLQVIDMADDQKGALFVEDNETISGQTSTEFGIRKILADLHASKDRFDLVIFDFITACNSPEPGGRTTTLLNVMALFKQAKNTYGAPFVVFAQLSDKTKLKPEFGQRLQWATHLVNDATLCVEIIKDEERKRTMLRRHQTRFDTGNLPGSAVARFDSGRILDLSSAEMSALQALLADDDPT